LKDNYWKPFPWPDSAVRSLSANTPMSKKQLRPDAFNPDSRTCEK